MSRAIFLPLALCFVAACADGSTTRICSVDSEIHGYRLLIETDAELEKFRGCRVIEGPVVIGGTVSSLEPLSDLEEVETFRVVHSVALEDLQGLESLVDARQLEFSDNPRLRTLDGLGAVHDVEAVAISDNPRLESIDAISKIRTAPGGAEGPRWSLSDNEQLQDFSPIAEPLAAGEAPTLRLWTDLSLDLEHVLVCSDYATLTLDAGILENTDALKVVQSANTISLHGGGLDDLSPLENLQDVRSLAIHRSGIESLSGLDPDLMIHSLTLVDLPSLESAADATLNVVWSFRMEDLPRLTDASGIRMVDDGSWNNDHFQIEACPQLEQLPDLSDIEGVHRFTLRDTGVSALDAFEHLNVVDYELVLWSNPNLDQAAAEQWAEARGEHIVRVGENDGWVQPDECPWLDDNFCDEAFGYCDVDVDDCRPNVGS